MRLVRVGAGAGVLAQLGLEVRVDRSGFDEADQAVGEVRFLGPGGQPDGQPPGGDVVDDGAAAVGFGDAVGDEPLVQGQVGERPVLRAAGRRVLPEVLRRYRSHTSVMRCFSGELGKLPLGDAASSAGLDAVSRCSVGCLAVWLPAGLVPAGG